MEKILISNGHILTDKDNSIFTVETSEGGSVNVNVPGGWQGTPVPNSGYVENVYFNTALSVDEVVSILDTISYNEEIGMEVILGSELDENGNSNIIFISKANNVWTIMVNFGDTLQEILFVSSDDYDLGFVGWNTNITYPLAINFNAVNELDGIAFGSQNNLLSSLFSTTPFVQASGEEIELSGEYDGSKIVLNELPKTETAEGTEVPSSGYVENVYFNTNLSVEKVVDILSELNFVPDPTGDGITLWSCFTDSTMDTAIAINYWVEDDVYRIYLLDDDSNTPVCVFSTDTNGDFFGWHTDFNGVASFNMENMLSLVGPPIGFTPENEKATMLFSTTPFEKISEDNTINLQKYIDEQKLPLQIKVNLPKTQEMYIAVVYEAYLRDATFDISNLVFNNPDNIPIYKGTLSAMGMSLSLYNDELSFRIVNNNITTSTIDDKTGFLIKAKDLIGKNAPYLSGVIVQSNQGTHGFARYFNYNLTVFSIVGILQFFNSNETIQTAQITSGNFTISKLALSFKPSTTYLL